MNLRKKDKSKIRWTGSSEYLKQAFDLTKIVNTRFRIFMALICLCMTVILIRLYSIQIVHNAEYKVKLENYSKKNQTVTTPRGEILDRNGEVLVGNRQRLNITYFAPSNMTDKKEWALAYTFGQNFNVSIADQRFRDLKDLYIACQTTSFSNWVKESKLTQYEFLFSEDAKKKYSLLITDEEWQKNRAGDLTSSDIYYLRLARITEDDVAVFDEELRKAWSVKQSMSAGTAGLTKNILSDVSNEEIAYLTEHSESYPGFDVEIDWDRQYPYKSTLKAVFGTVTTSKQGIPSDGLDKYLALGYSRNEKVGKSGLELQYEDILAGERKVYEYAYDENGVAIPTIIESGRIGYDIETTIDINMQTQVDQLLKNYLMQYENDPRRLYMNKIAVVVMDPSNGDVLSLSTVYRDEDNDIISDPVKTYTDAYVVGSVVKGAVLYAGQTEGVIKPGEKIFDTPMKIQASPTKSSWKDLGLIDDIQAIAQSSNIYMIQTVIRMAGGVYRYDGPLYVASGTYAKMRNYFSQFGLGVKTGIDIPNEAVGVVGKADNSGNILDYAIGQYDTYTPMQLAQYVSAIANGGTKYQPRLVSRAFESGTDNVVYENHIKVLGELENKTSIKRIQMGFEECVYGRNGICKGALNDASTIAAKTGTAETVAKDIYDKKILYTDPKTGKEIEINSPTNSTIAYFPKDNPVLAVACVIPNAWNGDKSQTNLCPLIIGDIAEIYYGLKTVEIEND